MPELSTEFIAFGILTRVPPKAVGRCRCVCKAWNALLSGNAFVREHCSRSAISSNQKVLVIEHQTSSIHPINFETHDYEPGTSVTIPFDHRSYDNRFNVVKILSHLNGLLRRDATLAVNVYSRRYESWRNIPLTLPAEYLTTRFCWSSGTLCGGSLYFTVSESVVGGIHFMISFDVNSEQFHMMNIPPIPNHGIGFIRLVDAQDELVMFAATGFREMTINMWTLQEGTWYQINSFPAISLDTWCSITHYVTNGNKWLVMAKFQKIFEIDTGLMWFDRFYPVTSFQCSNDSYPNNTKMQSVTMKKAQNEASAYSPGPGPSASRPQNAKCSNCIKLKQDIMELKKKLEWYKTPQRK
ncbi:F-box domain-containing protein [Artemisia annua]|uniref:F-box domain-containing protein n=1 Tax=Artemisia annua TaxID=35608 RepID=A0A2U1NFZ0_ARTAN|nr:F-box domain-containing protein [Artemisia annua]